MSHRTPVKKDKLSQSGSLNGSSGRHKVPPARTATKEKKGSASQTSQKAQTGHRGALSEVSPNVQKDPKAGDKSLKKNPDSPSTQKHSSVVAAPASKTSRKPKHHPGYLTFKLSAAVNKDILNGVRPSTLLASYMPSPPAGQGSVAVINPSEELISTFQTIITAGLWIHIYVLVCIGKEDQFEAYLLADSGSAITALNEQSVIEHMKKNPRSDLLNHPVDMNVKMRYNSSEPRTSKLYKNTILVNHHLEVEDQLFAVTPGLPGDGILGMGRTSQTKGKIEGQPDKEIPTVLDNLVKNGTLEAAVLGFHLFPWNEAERVKERISAELHYGGIDESAIIKNTLRTIPITECLPSSEAFGLDVEITYGGSNGERVCILDMKEHLATGITDVGEYGILLPEKAVEEYMKAIDAEASPPQHGSKFSFWSIPRKNLLKLEPLALHFKDINGRKVTFKLPVEAQLFPPMVTDEFDLPKDRLYLTVKARPQARPGFGLVLGAPVLMRLYFAFEISNEKRVMKIAKSRYIDAESPGLAEIRRKLIKEGR